MTAPSPAERLFQAGIEQMRARFDAERGLLAQHTNTGVFHPTRESLGYAYALCIAGGPAAVPEAERIIERVLRAQERRPGNIHHGGFKWMDEDQGVTDLNAVQFALEQLLPFYQDFGEHLSDGLRAALLEAFRIAAAELEHLDVRVFYTNIALLDTLNTLLAAEVLGDEHLAARGRRRLDEWIAFTNRCGAVFEYNSPTYLAVDLGALAELAERAADPAVRVKAQIMEERLWLHAAVHYHHPTAQLAGPHSRAYHNDVTGGICGIKVSLFSLLGDERLLRRSQYATQRQHAGSVRAARRHAHLPAYLERLLREKPDRYAAAETTDIERGIDLYTYMTPAFALGTASTGSHAQSNHVICYYRAPAPRDVGVLFARYIVNEKSFGSHYHATDRSTANNLNEEGQFWGMQHEGKSIALYGLQPQREPVHSLKAEVYVLDRAQISEIWVNDAPAGELPRRLMPHDALLIADGEAYIAIRPLAPSCLGDEAPILLQEREGELVLSIYNYYQGEAKSFWEYASLSGPFYKGNIRSGFILEVAGRGEFESLAAFCEHILRGAISDTLDGATRRVRYASGADTIEIAVDLFTNRLVERRINGAVYRPPMLASPTAVQGTGALAVGAARLACENAPAWLVADDQSGCWAAANPSDQAVIWELETPIATVRSAAFGFGRMVVSSGEAPAVEVLAVRREVPLRVAAAAQPRVTWNGLDVSAECRYDRRSGEYVLPAEG